MDRPRPKVFWTRQRKIALLFAVPLATLTVYALFADLGTSKLKIDADKVTVSTVKRGPFHEYIAITGELEPLRTVYLETLEGGRAEEIYLEEGSLVEQGDPILRLSNADLELETMQREDQYVEQVNQLFNVRQQMDQLERDFEKRMAELDYLILKQKRKYQRDVELREAQLISELEYELSRDEYNYLVREKELEMASEDENRRFRDAQIRQLEQSVERRKKNLEIAEGKLEKLIIKAPIAGELTSRDIEVGQSKAPGERLGQIDSTAGFKVRARIDQHYLGRVDTGQIGGFEFSGETYKLQTTKIYSEVMEGKFEVDMIFESDVPRGIKRGQTLHIRLALGGLSEVVHVRNGAFFQKTGGKWAFVLDETGELAVRREIRLGRQNPDFFEVLAGLEPGEHVITSSYDRFEGYDQIVLRN